MAKSPRKLAWKKAKRATIGIGTMIVFIALVLVAAIASAVILKTAYSLKDAAERSGHAAVSEVSGGLKIQDITGDRDYGGAGPPYGDIEMIKLWVTVWEGNPGVDISKMKVHWIGPTVEIMLPMDRTNNPPVPTTTAFGADDENSDTGDGWDPTATPPQYFLLNDNMIYIAIDLRPGPNGIGDELGPGETAVLYFELSAGLTVKEEFTAPLSFGSQRFIDLTMQ
ncbi:MAG: hypothetical protein QW379_03395 [Thermoplasmata archaeon]